MRLIELRPSEHDVLADLTVAAGDLLKAAASGGHVRTGDAVEFLGAFSTAVVGADGSVLTPAGAPNTVLFRAARPGTATIDIVVGDPFHAARQVTVAVSVDS